MGLFSRRPEAVERGPRRRCAVRIAASLAAQQPQAARDARRQSRCDAPPLDPAEASKTRARRRLIGAVALGLAAIVFVPMLFDRTPVAPSDDIALQIPDRDTPFEGRRGVPDPARGPLRPAADLPVVPPPRRRPRRRAHAVATARGSPAGSDGRDDRDAGTGAEDRHAGREGTPRSDRRSRSRPSAAKPTRPQPADRDGAATSTPATTRGRSPRSKERPSAATAAAPAASSYAVQIAAFSAADEAQGCATSSSRNGLKSYTESVSTVQGLRTRVRLGPFASREAADRAKQKLKTMKLDGSVVPLCVRSRAPSRTPRDRARSR